MSKVVHQQRAVRVKGSWRYGVPGAVAIISAVAFVTGVVTIRKGLGIQHAVPRDWPEVRPRIEDPAPVFSGEPLPLERALARAGAERVEPLAHLAR